MIIRKYMSLLAVLIMVFGGSSLSLADDHWADDGKIKVEGKAKSAGKISFKLSYKPNDKETVADQVVIDVLVPDKTKKNEIAEMIINSFRAMLGDENFKIKQSWGNNVIVEAKGKTPDFNIEFSSNSIQGISLEIDD